MTTPAIYCFESSYDDGNGTRFDVVWAYSLGQAICLAALSVLTDNEWKLEPQPNADPDAGIYSQLIAWWDNHMTVEAERGDLGGAACPACTSHDTHEHTSIEIGDVAEDEPYVPVHQCKTCNFEWAALGRPSIPETRTSEQIDAAIEAWIIDELGEDQ